MTIKSPEFSEGESIPSKFTCDGENINPRLEITGVPSNAKSLALIVDDPDSPSGNWLHWSIWNISPKIKYLEEGKVPAGAIEGMTDFRSIGYGGPCPGQGTHRYQFSLYALDCVLDLAPGAKRDVLEVAMRGHIIENNQLAGIYKRII